MQVVAFQCLLLFNDFILKSKVRIGNFYDICAIHENYKCETLF
jgi:hypothetical protein